MLVDWNTCHPAELYCIYSLQPPPMLHFSNWLGILRNINSRQALHCFMQGAGTESPSRAAPLLGAPEREEYERWDHMHLLIFSLITVLHREKGIQKMSLTYSAYSASYSTEDWLNHVDTNVFIKTEAHSTLPHIHSKKMNLLFTTIRKHSLLDRLFSMFFWVDLFCLLATLTPDDTAINMEGARSLSMHVF